MSRLANLVASILLPGVAEAQVPYWDRILAMRGARSVLVLLISLSQASAAGAAAATEFWAVLSEDATRLEPLVVVVVNPSITDSAQVIIDTVTASVTSAIIPPGAREVFDLGLSQQVSGTSLRAYAYRIRSDIPVHAYQFRDYDTAFTTVAGSVLVDESLFGRTFVVLAGSEPISPREWYPSVVTIVAREPSQVSVTVSRPTRAGGPVPALNAGDTYSRVLDAFDVLQIAGVPNEDITGTLVTASAPVEVFAGCDRCHIEDSAADTFQDAQLPVASWESVVPVASSAPIAQGLTRWRILAATDGTTVTTDPVVPGTPVQLDSRKFVELDYSGSFVTIATAPVQVARFTVYNAGGVDPSLCLMLPPSLFTTGASFALTTIPGTTSWIDVIARTGARVLVDGAQLLASEFTQIGNSEYFHAQVRLGSGSEVHRVEADCPVAAYAGFIGPATTASFPIDVSSDASAAPGEVSSTVPLLLTKDAIANLRFSWEDMPGAGTVYNIYEGRLRDIWSHGPLSCGVSGAAAAGGRREVSLTPGADSRYYLVSAAGCSAEGPTGADPALSTCPP